MKLCLVCLTGFWVALFTTNLSAVTVSTTITFDSLASGSTHIEGVYVFQGYMERDASTSYPTKPVARIFGNNPVTISRVDGQRFTLASFDVAFKYDVPPDWRIDNETGSGFAISRAGTFTSGQFPTTPMTDVLSLTISDPAFRGGSTFYEFDNFIFNHTAVPMPSALRLFGSGLIGLFGIAERRAQS